MRALCLLSDGPNYRREDFISGLRACGYEIVKDIPTPRPEDVLVIWNRSGNRDFEARRFEASGARVLVAENGYFGKVWQGFKWFALSLGHHAGAGDWKPKGPERWDRWGVETADWKDGRDVVILEQRGIGEAGIASPRNWAQDAQRRIGGRIRPHPGAGAPAVSLADDLKDARCVVTWHSGAAFHALLMGVPVFYEFGQWIGRAACAPLAQFNIGPVRGDRLDMFRSLAWAMWTDEEVRSGEAFGHLLAH